MFLYKWNSRKWKILFLAGIYNSYDIIHLDRLLPISFPWYMQDLNIITELGEHLLANCWRSYTIETNFTNLVQVEHKLASLQFIICLWLQIWLSWNTVTLYVLSVSPGYLEHLVILNLVILSRLMLNFHKSCRCLDFAWLSRDSGYLEHGYLEQWLYKIQSNLVITNLDITKVPSRLL